MGGDFAPAAIVEGAVQALKACEDIEKLFLVGDKDAVEKELARCKCTDGRIEIRHASEVVGMGEHPAAAVRHKRDSSITRATDLVKNGEADAVFAAGSTGAAVTSSVLKMRTLPGIRRPGIAVILPAPKKPFILIDGGATPDCSPEILVQFAVMGTAYAQQVLGVEDPTVGLMSVGSEDTKGNGLGKETFSLLEAAPIRFYGNVEGTDLFESRVDVVVCDGFTGNVILKTSEGLAHAVGQWMKGEVTKNPWRMLGTLLLAGALKAIKKKTSNKTYGGAPLLGVNGICIIGHGSSDATAAKNGILQAVRAVKSNLNQHILSGIGAISEQAQEKARAISAAQAAQAAANAAAEAVRVAQALLAAQQHAPAAPAPAPEAPAGKAEPPSA
jgi:glycerol-3-phosphate acyltransferase PlsX